MIHLLSLFFTCYSYIRVSDGVERECEAMYSGVESEQRGRRPSQVQRERGGGWVVFLYLIFLLFVATVL